MTVNFEIVIVQIVLISYNFVNGSVNNKSIRMTKIAKVIKSIQ